MSTHTFNWLHSTNPHTLVVSCAPPGSGLFSGTLWLTKNIIASRMDRDVLWLEVLEGGRECLCLWWCRERVAGWLVDNAQRVSKDNNNTTATLQRLNEHTLYVRATVKSSSTTQNHHTTTTRIFKPYSNYPRHPTLIAPVCSCPHQGRLPAVQKGGQQEEQAVVGGLA